MSFRPNAHDTLIIGDTTYVIAEHPAAPGMPYGQEGRAGVVYRLLLPLPETEDGGVALKVLRPRFRTPSLVSQAEKLETYAALPGLQVCRRTVLTRVHNADLLQHHPDLIYAVLMPWIAGPTWLEVLLDKRPLTFEQALSMARAFAEILESMELRGVAHCDLSGPNVLLPALADHGPQTADSSPSSAVALVDVEGLYAPGLLRPEALPSGSSGYAHRTAHEGLWGPTADRYAGAILLAEMLGWGDENVRKVAWSETYFDPAEMPGRASAGTPRPERYQILLAALVRHYGENIANLFERAWHSETLADCPTFGEWLVALPEKMADHELQITEDQPQTDESSELLVTLRGETIDHEPQAIENQPQTIESSSAVGGEPSEDTTAATIRALMQAAQTLEEDNNLVGALAVYRQAQSLATIEPGLLVELNAIVQDLDQRTRRTERQSTFALTSSSQKGEPVPVVEEASATCNQMASIEPTSAPSGDADEPPCLAETPERVSGKPGWGFFVLWVLMNAFGGALSLIAADAFWNVGIDVSWVTFWTLAGLAQWIAVRKYVQKAGWWILASVIGGIMAQTTIYVIGSITNDMGLFNVPALVYFVMMGISVGLAQWLALRKHVRKAGWWILTIAIGVSAVFEGIPAMIEALGIGYSALFSALYGALLGAVSGIITGPVLLWLLRNSRPEVDGVAE